MAWIVASLEFPGEGCPAAAHVGEGDELECLSPLSIDQPVGTMDKTPRPPWDVVAPRGRRWLARMSGATCRGCPVRHLPPEPIVLGARVRDGTVRCEAAFPSVERLAEVVSELGDGGCTARLRRLRNGGNGKSQDVSVNLGRLTPRQRTVLREAHRLGYFEPGGRVTLDEVAGALGLGRSTVHEHLQKGLRAVLSECMAP